MTEHDGTTGPGDWAFGQQPPQTGPPTGPVPPGAQPPYAGQPGPAAPPPIWGDNPQAQQQYPTRQYPTQQYPNTGYTQQYPNTAYPGQQHPGGPTHLGPGVPAQPDWLSSHAGGPGGRRPRRGRLTLAVAASVVAVLAVAGGAYAVLGSHDTTPDHYVPADAIAVLSADLDATNSQTIAAARFLGAFPTLAKNDSSHDLVDIILRSSFSDTDQKAFERDVKPWLGPHVAIAADPQGAKVRPLIVAEVTDKAEAQAGLSRLVTKSDDVGFVLRDNYAIISDTSGAASRASTDSEKSSIADDIQYKHDVGALDDNRIATGWADVSKAVQFAGDESTRFRNLPKLSGRAAFALRFTADHAELEARLFGSSTLPSGVVGPQVTALPGNTSLALGVAGLDKAVTRVMDALDQAGLSGALDVFTARTGLELPDDITALIGDRAVFAANSDLSGFGLVTSPNTDADAAERTANKLLAALGDPHDVVVRHSGDHLVLASTSDYANQLASGGHLGEQKLFRTAVPDAANASLVEYVNLPQVISAVGDDVPPDVKALRAVGLTVAVHGDVSTVRIRVVVG